MLGDPDARACTDLGNAERLVAWCGDEPRDVAGWEWLAWDGRRFIADRAAALEKAKYAARMIFREVAEEPDPRRARLTASVLMGVIADGQRHGLRIWVSRTGTSLAFEPTSPSKTRGA